MTALNKQALRMRNYLDTALKSGVKLLHLSTDELEGLLDELEKTQKGEKQWHEVVDAFCIDDADWHKLTTSNNELISFLSQALCKQVDRIAELEARTVTLPQRLQSGADGYDDWYVHSADDGEYLKVDDVIEAIRAAGIGVKGDI